MFTRTLFLAGISSFSERALVWASGKISRNQSDFLVLHVVDPAAGIEAPHVVREAEFFLEELCARPLSPESYYKTKIISGDVLETLPEIIRAEGCTFALLLLPKGVDGIPLIRAITVPQLVLREEGFFPSGDVFGRIIVALDLEPSRTSLILDNLRSILTPSEGISSIVLVHAVSPHSTEDASYVLNAASETLEKNPR